MSSSFFITGGSLISSSEYVEKPNPGIRVEDGLIAGFGADIREGGDQVIDTTGCVIGPALIDLHTHIYWGATSLGVPPEYVAARSGTGTFVDAGSAGSGNFLGYRTFINDRSKLRCFAFLNVSYAGIFGFGADISVGEGELASLLDFDSCLRTAAENQDLIKGIKVRAGAVAAGANGELAIQIGRRVADELGLPLMCHVDNSPPSIQEGLSYLRTGDILTHCCKPTPNTVVDDNGSIIPELLEAIQRGVLLDIGHGMGGYDFEVSRQLLDAGIPPDTISSDIHSLSVDGPAFDQLTTMNKMIALGMPVSDVFAASIKTPAAIINQPQLATLELGTPADIAIFEWRMEPLTLVDASKNSLVGERHLNCKHLLVDGQEIAAHDATRHPFSIQHRPSHVS